MTRNTDDGVTGALTIAAIVAWVAFAAFATSCNQVGEVQPPAPTAPPVEILAFAGEQPVIARAYADGSVKIESGHECQEALDPLVKMLVAGAQVAPQLRAEIAASIAPGRECKDSLAAIARVNLALTKEAAKPPEPKVIEKIQDMPPEMLKAMATKGKK